MNTGKPFKILSIDGGGMRGILPARVLCEMEEELDRRGFPCGLNNYFDLICGTSTGGIIALGLGLGMKAEEILKLYRDNASKIFQKKSLRIGMRKPLYSNHYLKELLEEKFKAYSSNGDTRLGHSKTRLCIPTYNSKLGKAHVYKTAHHEKLIRDYQIPAHHVAMSTAAAPVFFPPYSFQYSNIGSSNLIHVDMNIDGGVIANNPTHLGIMEAHHTLGVPFSELKVLSLGTGDNVFSEQNANKGFGFWYWGSPKVRLTELIFSAQSQNTDNVIKFLNNGIGEGEQSKFYYKRIQHSFNGKDTVRLDETDPKKLRTLEAIGINAYRDHGAEIMRQFLSETKREFNNLKPL